MSEFLNAYTLSNVTKDRTGVTEDEIAAHRGKYVEVISEPDFCRFTDAPLGSKERIGRISKKEIKPEAAEDWSTSRIYDQEGNKIYDVKEYDSEFFTGNLNEADVPF